MINTKIKVAALHIGLFLLVCASASIINGKQIIDEIIVFQKYYSAWDKILLYSLIYLLCCIAIFLIFYLKNIWVSNILILFLSLAFFTEYIFKSVNGGQIGYDDFLMIFNSSEHVLDVLSLFQKYVLVYILLFISLVILRLSIKKFAFLSLKKYFVLFAVSLLSAYFVVKVSNGHRVSFPSLQKMIVLSFYTFNHKLYAGKRIALNEKNNPIGSVEHILLIVDESIRGDLLEINGGKNPNTPFLKSIINEKILNFGVSYSGAVCSDYSNIILISGIQLKDLPDLDSKSRKVPQIFQYAKKAGYHTSYIDCQSYDNSPDGYLTDDDLSYIDANIQVKPHFPNSYSYENDRNALKFLQNNLKNPKSFTYLVKYGCHFPFNNTYPNIQQVFKPVKDMTSWNRDSKQGILNSYNNAILWAVDGFWQKLDSIVADYPDLVVIYTSDHGQNIFDDEQITATHCYKGPAPAVMAKVPLFIYSPDMAKIQHFKSQAIMQNHPYSHFQIFPTAIDLMGYKGTSNVNPASNLLNGYLSLTDYFTSGDIYGRSKMFKNKIKVEK